MRQEVYLRNLVNSGANDVAYESCLIDLIFNRYLETLRYGEDPSNTIPAQPNRSTPILLHVSDISFFHLDL